MSFMANAGNIEPSTSTITPPPSSFTDELQTFEDDEGRSAEGGATEWTRPSPPGVDPTSDKIIFQQIDIEDYQEFDNVTSLRMFGVTSAGHSVLANVTGFKPYFYAVSPPELHERDLGSLTNVLNNSLGKPVVMYTELVVKRISQHRDNRFIKITVRDQHELRDVIGLIENGLKFGHIWLKGGTRETDIPFVLRFMVDTEIVGMNWIEVPPGSYNLIAEKKSHCQIEISTRWDAFISHNPEGQWSILAPLRILSFDIECVVRGVTFPEAHTDSVLQIANMVTRQGDSKPFVRNVFTLNTCAAIAGAQVLEFMDELEMLIAWRNFVEEVDPDLIIGYNIANFDIPYLLDRAKTHNDTSFPYLGRLKDVQAQTKQTQCYLSSSSIPTKGTCLNGRLQIDLYQVMRRENKLTNNSLNAVSAHYLGDQKEDVHFSKIMELQNGTTETRRRLAIYCLKDAYLPQKLLDKFTCLTRYTDVARTTGVPFSYILSRGEPAQSLSQRYRIAHTNNAMAMVMS